MKRCRRRFECNLRAASTASKQTAGNCTAAVGYSSVLQFKLRCRLLLTRRPPALRELLFGLQTLKRNYIERYERELEMKTGSKRSVELKIKEHCPRDESHTSRLCQSLDTHPSLTGLGQLLWFYFRKILRFCFSRASLFLFSIKSQRPKIICSWTLAPTFTVNLAHKKLKRETDIGRNFSLQTHLRRIFRGCSFDSSNSFFIAVTKWAKSRF